MKLHPVTHVKGDTNRFCGPSAISIVTGMNTGEAARLIREVTGKTSVMGTHTHHIEKALAKCGVQMRFMSFKPLPKPVMIRGKPNDRPTLTQWLRDTQKERTPGRVFLLAAGNHWQIISGRRYCCGQTKQIVSIKDDKVKRRARVEEVYELVVKDKVVIPVVAAKPKVTRKLDPSRKALLTLEKRLGVKGSIDRSDGYTDYVLPPFDGYPNGISTLHYDWFETLDRIEEALEHPDRLDDSGWLSR